MAKKKAVLRTCFNTGDKVFAIWVRTKHITRYDYQLRRTVSLNPPEWTEWEIPYRSKGGLFIYDDAEEALRNLAGYTGIDKSNPDADGVYRHPNGDLEIRIVEYESGAACSCQGKCNG